MYSETLKTPHPLKSARTPDATLHEVLQLDSVSQNLAQLALEDAGAYDLQLMNSVDSISRQVSKALWYPMGSKHDDNSAMSINNANPLETITSYQATNCYGYTLVASECMQKAGIKHYIAYANGHAFTMVPTKTNGLYLADALSSELNQPLGQALTRGSAHRVEQDIETHGRAAIMVSSAHLDFGGASVEEMAAKHPWLVFDSSNRLNDRGNWYFGTDGQEELQKYRSRYNLVVSLFDSVTGQRSIEGYVELQQAVTARDIGKACLKLEGIQGIFPEIDARQAHEELEVIVRALCEAGQSEKATEIIHAYFDTNFVLTTDSRLPEARGDMLRKVAKRSGSIAAAHGAAQAYEEASKRPMSFKQALAGKLAAARTLLNELKQDTVIDLREQDPIGAAK